MNRANTQRPCFRSPLFSTLAASLLIAGCGGELDEVQTDQSLNAVYGGTLAPAGYTPFMASVQEGTSGKHKCGAVIVADQWLVTAGHCVYASAPATLSVRVGSSQYASGGTLVPVSQVVLHPKFSLFSIENDIAVLKLASRIPYSGSAHPTKLPQQFGDEPDGAKDLLFGWGATSAVNNTYTYSPDLLMATVKVVNRTTCQSSWGVPITGAVICAGTANKSSCPGDDGGPLMNGGGSMAVGIVAVSTCGQATPAIYTRLGWHSLWIESATGGAVYGL